MNRPWMPLYVGDYLGDTGHLTTAQHGAYLLLMMHYWRKGELPDDDRQLSKITKLPLKTWCDYRATLQDFFHEGWKHKRIDVELAKMVRVSEKRAIAGQKGGLGSALARMKLENASRSRQVLSREALSQVVLPQQVLPRAIAAPLSSAAAAAADHSHSNSHQSLPKDEIPDETRAADASPHHSRKCREKPAIAVSPELAAYVRRTT
jgi:uncharacterized protein YdaU (DUF1376 family)